jgi:hypothetical protein
MTWVDHCPAAVGFAEAGAPTDRRVFAVGTACHAFLEAAPRGQDLDDVAVRLLSVGRTGPDPEPPLPAMAVLEGRALAAAWMEHVGLRGQWAERRFSFDEDWRPTDGAPYYSTRIDYVEHVEDVDEDGYATSTVTMGDYKTSWQASENDLDTVQRRFHALCAFAEFPGATHIVLEIAAVRRRQVYRRVIVLDEEGLALLESWRAEIGLVAAAMRSGYRIARPSPGCATCPWAGGCKAAEPYLTAPGELVATWGAAKGIASATESALRALSADDPVDLDGWRIGAAPTPTRKVKPGVTAALLAATMRESGIDGPLLDDVAALWGDRYPMTVAQVETASKALPRGERAAWLAERLETVIEPRWGVRKVGP